MRLWLLSVLVTILHQPDTRPRQYPKYTASLILRSSYTLVAAYVAFLDQVAGVQAPPTTR